MPISTVVYLTPTEDVGISPTMGHHAHAAFLSLLRLGNPNRAKQIHDLSTHKPFTVSPLIGRGKLKNGLLQFKMGTECRIRFTFLEDDLFNDFGRAFYTSPLPQVQIGKGTFEVIRLNSSKAAGEIWSGHKTYDELLENAIEEPFIKLKFYSPTAFRRMENRPQQQNAMVDLVRCYQSWIRKWNVFAPIPLDKEEILDVARFAELRQINVKTKVLDFGRHKEAGFIGECTFAVGKPEKYRVFNLLADFAFYAGTGYKATMGMGQTRKIQDGRKDTDAVISD